MPATNQVPIHPDRSRRAFVRRALRPTIAIALVSGLLVAGCGDDDDDDAGIATSELSKQEWVEQANEICAKGNEEVGKAAQETFSQGEPSQQQVEEFALDVAMPGTQEQVDEIRALGAPEGDENEIAAILDTAQEGIEEIHDDPSKLDDGESTLDEASQQMAEYGVAACGA